MAKQHYEAIVKFLLQVGAEMLPPVGLQRREILYFSEADRALIKKYEHIVGKRKRVIAEFLNEQANQQTGYATGGHESPPAILGDLVQQFEGTTNVQFNKEIYTDERDLPSID